jgi:orotate phosphoribosyltransferase
MNNDNFEKKDLHHIVSSVDGLSSILEKLYQDSFIPSVEKPHFRRDGKQDSWALDLKKSLSRSVFLAPVCQEMSKILKKYNIRQIAGKGYGSFLLIGGIVAINAEISCSLLRETPKGYGFKNLMEGSLCKNELVFVIDDILSSGKTAKNIFDTLIQQDFQPGGVLTVFRYGWRKAIDNLASYRVIIESLGIVEYN